MNLLMHMGSKVACDTLTWIVCAFLVAIVIVCMEQIFFMHHYDQKPKLFYYKKINDKKH